MGCIAKYDVKDAAVMTDKVKAYWLLKQGVYNIFILVDAALVGFCNTFVESFLDCIIVNTADCDFIWSCFVSIQIDDLID